MEQEKIIKLTLTAQIAGQLSSSLYCREIDPDYFVNTVVDLSKKIADKLITE